MSSSPEESLQQLLLNMKTLLLSTLNKEGLPNISYAPFFRDEDGVYYIFISQLANHTQDLLTNPVAAIMLAADEQDTQQVFARTRVTYQCHVERVAVENHQYEMLLDQFSIKFGSVIDVLRDLPDFILFRLTPEHGRFVKGFGQAYELKGKLLQELKPVK